MQFCSYFWRSALNYVATLYCSAGFLRNLIIILSSFPSMWWVFLSWYFQNSLSLIIETWLWWVLVNFLLDGICLGISELHVPDGHISSQIWKISSHYFSNKFLSLSLPLFFFLDSHNEYIILFDWFHNPHRLSLLFFMIITFFSSDWIISRYMSSPTQILYSIFFEPVVKIFYCILKFQS